MWLMATTKITYRFLFQDGRVLEHDVVMDADTGKQVSSPAPSGQPWAELEHKKCKHCPLKKEDHPECPPAKNLALVADAFKAEKSFEKVTVEVVTAERTFRKQIMLQEGLFGLFGLIMATSQCPYFGFLRPMARFHLPFSSSKETTVRSVSFYLLKQFFVAKKGGKPDFELAHIGKLYKDLEEVNLGMVARIRSITKADAEANSIVILDGLAKILSMQLNNKLADLDKMFEA